MHITNSFERGGLIFPTERASANETLFDKLDAFHLPYSDERKLFKKLDFLILSQFVGRLKKSNLQKLKQRWGKCILIPVSKSYFFQNKFPLSFLGEINPRDLVPSFIDALEKLAQKEM